MARPVLQRLDPCVCQRERTELRATDFGPASVTPAIDKIAPIHDSIASLDFSSLSRSSYALVDVHDCRGFRRCSR